MRDLSAMAQRAKADARIQPLAIEMSRNLHTQICVGGMRRLADIHHGKNLESLQFRGSLFACAGTSSYRLCRDRSSLKTIRNLAAMALIGLVGIWYASDARGHLTCREDIDSGPHEKAHGALTV